MWKFWNRARSKPSAHKFRPALENPLEERLVLNSATSIAEARYLLKHPSSRNAKLLGTPPFRASDATKFTQEYSKRLSSTVQVARGGQAALVKAKDGTRYRLQLGYNSNTLAITTSTSGSDGNQTNAPTTGSTTGQASIPSTNYPQPQGTIRVYPMAKGMVGIIVDGSTANTELTISQLPNQQVKGQAHSFAYGESRRGHILNVGQLTVTSGAIGSILGFHTAFLSGPLIVSGNNPVDRIAFDQITPGASIQTGGDVNTLDVYNSITLDSGVGIEIGRDLNLLNVGGDISLSNGASFVIGRDLGLTLQPPKGTGTGSNVLSLNNANLTNTSATYQNVATYIQGDINIGQGSQFVISRFIDNQFYLKGAINGFSRFFFGGSTVPPNSGGTPNTFLVYGGTNG